MGDDYTEWMRLRALYMNERLASLTPSQSASLTEAERLYHQRAASTRATRELKKRERLKKAHAELLADFADPIKRAERERAAQEHQASERERQLEAQRNTVELRSLLMRLPGDCKQSPPAHLRRYKARGVTPGILQFCSVCDRVACRVRDGSRDRGGFRCAHRERKYYVFTMVELSDRTMLLFDATGRSLGKDFRSGEQLAQALAVLWIGRDRMREIPWTSEPGMNEDLLRRFTCAFR